MTAATLTESTPASYRLPNFLDTAHSEWTKLRSVPSSIWTLIAAAVLGVGLSALFSGLAAHAYSTGSHDVRANWDPTGTSTSGLAVAQIAIGVLGVLAISSEYSSGAIRTSLSAVPRRSRFLAAKAAVIAAVAFVTGELMAFVTFFLGQALIHGNAPTAALGDPHVLRAVFGSGLYFTLIGLLGVGLGSVLRSAAGAITAIVALLYVLPGLAAALPASIEHVVEKFWPTEAGQQITDVVRTSNTLPAWLGFGVLLLFTALILGMAVLRLERRDA